MSQSGRTDKRRMDALSMRLSGATFRQIAEANKCSLGQAHKDVDAALREWGSAPADELREIEAARLDRLQLAIWQRALSGDYKAIDKVLAIMDRRAKLFGLDKHPRIEITHYIRQKAIEEGLDPDEAVRAAEEITSRLRW